MTDAAGIATLFAMERMKIEVRCIVVGAVTGEAQALVLARSAVRAEPELTAPTSMRIKVSLRVKPTDTLRELRERARDEALRFLDVE